MLFRYTGRFGSPRNPQRGYAATETRIISRKDAKHVLSNVEGGRKGRKITVKNLLQNNSSLPSELGALCALAGVNSLCSNIPVFVIRSSSPSRPPSW